MSNAEVDRKTNTGSHEETEMGSLKELMNEKKQALVS